MKSALVTGASSGIGLAICKMLVEKNYKVFGVARDFAKCDFENENFIQLSFDLTKKQNLLDIYTKLKKEEICVLVNNAGVGHFGMHEELSVENIEQMVYLNLTSPIILTNKFLRLLKQNKSFIFNINSISGIKPAMFGATYGATKAGLKHFGTSLFDEARKSGLKVVNINPDITKTPFFDNLNFSYSSNEESFINPQDIAQVIKNVLQMNENVIPTDIILQPQKFQIERK
jgi:short-subunit dehydrogenase